MFNRTRYQGHKVMSEYKIFIKRESVEGLAGYADPSDGERKKTIPFISTNVKIGVLTKSFGMKDLIRKPGES